MDEGAKVKRRPRARLIFGVAVKDWLALKEGDWSGDTLRIERTNFGHLAGHFGGMSLRDISAEDISHYKTARKGAKASPKTIALELGSLRALMRKHRLWADLQPDVKIPVGRGMMSAGRCPRTRSTGRRSPARRTAPARYSLGVLLALHSGLRNQELRHLRWRQIDLIGNDQFPNGTVKVGKSKTPGGSGRVVPLSHTAERALLEWRSLFPGAFVRRTTFFVLNGTAPRRPMIPVCSRTRPCPTPSTRPSRWAAGKHPGRPRQGCGRRGSLARLPALIFIRAWQNLRHPTLRLCPWPGTSAARCWSGIRIPGARPSSGRLPSWIGDT